MCQEPYSEIFWEPLELVNSRLTFIKLDAGVYNVRLSTGTGRPNIQLQ